ERRVRAVRPRTTESSPADETARPVARARLRVANERLQCHRRTPLPAAVEIAIIRNARTRAAAGAAQHEQALMRVDESRERHGAIGVRRENARSHRIKVCTVPARGATRSDPMAKLYFYYSAMNAGKTTTLLQSAYNYHERGMRTLILTPALDHRGGEGMVASRIGLKAPGRRFDRDDDLLAFVRDDVAARCKLGCVLVGQAPFLSKAQVWQITDVVDVLGIPVLAYGLRTDFRGELFEGSQYLLAWADNLIEIKTICHTGKKATMVVRVDDEGRAVTAGPQVEIGGNERYVSVSRAEVKKIMSGEGRVELQQPGLPLGDTRRARRTGLVRIGATAAHGRSTSGSCSATSRTISASTPRATARAARRTAST